MDKRMRLFIQEQKNLTFCTSVNEQPYCANCFYAYLPEEKTLVFKSSEKTQHIQNGLVNGHVAGTILPDIGKTGEVRGAQFSGLFEAAAGDLLPAAKRCYYAKHPVALMMKGELWIIKLSYVKLTDNSFGFGNKLIWEKTAEQISR